MQRSELFRGSLLSFIRDVESKVIGVLRMMHGVELGHDPNHADHNQQDYRSEHQCLGYLKTPRVPAPPNHHGAERKAGAGDLEGGEFADEIARGNAVLGLGQDGFQCGAEKSRPGDEGEKDRTSQPHCGVEGGD